MYQRDKNIFPDPKLFLFFPAYYNTTRRVVHKKHFGKVLSHTPDQILIEYHTDDQLIGLFFRLALHTPAPDDAEPVYTPKEIREQNIKAIAFIVLYGSAFLAFLITIIVPVYRAIFGK